MLKKRPLIRFDGVYLCKMKYLKTGQSEWYEYNPIHEVISYRYIRLTRDGHAFCLYTT